MELFTRTHFTKLLENGQSYNDDPDFNPKPVVKLFNPVGAATWLIASVETIRTLPLVFVILVWDSLNWEVSVSKS